MFPLWFFYRIAPMLFWAVNYGSLTAAHPHPANSTVPGAALPAVVNGIPNETRVHWMRRAVAALSETSIPCAFAPFGTVIVDHKKNGTNGLGELVCSGTNAMNTIGNPSMHGEMAAISNCSAILMDPNGKYKMNASEALAYYHDLSLYTNAEPCPMCASAIASAGFKEYIYGTSIAHLTESGWAQIQIPSAYVMEMSHLKAPYVPIMIPDLLTNETDRYFEWQFNAQATCPPGCAREGGGICR